MKPSEIKEILAAGEDLHVEFKEARDRLPGSFFDTVCAFLNTDGGTIYLGVNDNGGVTGVEPRAVARLRSDIANLSNNPRQLDPPFLLFPHELTIDGKTVIAVQVPLSSQIHRHGGEIMLRSEDGDYRLRGTHQLAGLANRKLSLFSEQRVLPHLTIADLRPELFDKARSLMRIGDRRHPWLAFTDEELLKVGRITPDNVRPFPKNPTICKLMIQLGRFDELGSGVINVHRYLPLYANGATPVFQETGHSFTTTLPLAVAQDSQGEQVGQQVTPEVTEQVTEQVASLGEDSRLLQILVACQEKPRSSKELQAVIKIRHWPTFHKNFLTPLLRQNLLERTISNKPTSSKQKYRLTEKGKQLLAAAHGNPVHGNGPSQV